MFNLNDSICYYLYLYPIDMHKIIYTLSGVVKDLIG